MAELPILPLKTDSLLADTTHMSAEEFGVYCRILFVMWRHGGRLRDDDGEFSAIGGVPLKRWKAIREKVMRPMTIIEGTVSQKRLTDTWLNVQELRRKRAIAADIRWKGKPRPFAVQLHDQVESTSNAIKTKTKIDLPSFTESKSERIATPQGLGNGVALKRPDEMSAADLAAMYESCRKKAET